MSEALAAKRLKQVAVEFNISISTAVEFLNSKGFDIENKPTSKVTEEAYVALLQKFQPDKLTKEKSDKLKLTPLIHKEERIAEQRVEHDANQRAEKQLEEKRVVAEQLLVKEKEQANIAEQREEEQRQAERVPEPRPEPKIEPKPEPKPEPEPVVVVEKPVVVETPPAPVEIHVPKPAPSPEPVPEPVEFVKPVEVVKEVIEEKAPEEVHTLKILGKVDLDALGRKPKPVVKENKPEQRPEPVSTPAPVIEAKVEVEKTPEPVVDKAPEIVEHKTAPVVEPVKEEIIKAAEPIVNTISEPISQPMELVVEKPVVAIPEKQEEPVAVAKPAPVEEKEEEKKGLTIVGKIDLDQFKPKKKPLASTDDLSTMKKKRRKRKRIGEGDQPQRPATAGGPQDRPAGSGGPGGGGGGNNQHRPQGQGGGGPVRDHQNPPNNQHRPPINTPSHIQANAGKPLDKASLDEKRIQEEIKKTFNRLSKKTGATESKVKIKKRKREERKQRLIEESESTEGNLLMVTEFITANELATMMNVSVTQVIMTCLNLGLMVSINQRLDAETILVVADEFGFEVEFKDAEMDEPSMEEADNPDNVAERAPIVTIMGHVDHGKTSLLDYIRSSNIIAGEAGGITQHIGAYEVTLENGKRITFLDTPGHEAFTAMRARGAKGSDIAIIVIAADDTVMPQTREAISHAQAAGVPIVFAFNKIDKDGANTARIREQLAEMNILVEEWGGKYQSQEISAKKGLNIDKLLEKVLLEAEILELKADPVKRAVGTIIEASLDKGKGIVATVLVENGTLRVGDPLLAGSHFGKVKALFNERGGKVDSAGPSAPVQVLGFDGAPTAGDKFYVTENEQMAKDMSSKRKQLIREQGIRTRKHITLDEIGRRLAIGNFKELKVIIKGDVDGSVEALSDSLQRLSTEEIQVGVIFKSVGQITESDVLLASASDAIIIGFQVRPSMSARKLAEQEQIDIRMYSVIYDAIEEVKSAMEGMLAPTHEEKIICNVEIRDVFKISKVGTVAGCYVLDGKITRNTKIRVIRDGVVMHTGELDTLKRFKDDVKEVAAGYECGLTIKNFNDIEVGDLIEGYEEIQVARKL